MKIRENSKLPRKPDKLARFFRYSTYQLVSSFIKLKKHLFSTESCYFMRDALGHHSMASASSVLTDSRSLVLSLEDESRKAPHATTTLQHCLSL